MISTFDVPTEGLVFEEVTDRGYHIQFEKYGLDQCQSILALQKLAKFHAASVILMQDVRDRDQDFQEILMKILKNSRNP